LEKIVLFGSRARPTNGFTPTTTSSLSVKEKERPLINALYDATMEVLFKRID
jgi:hypothetical protein